MMSSFLFYVLPLSLLGKSSLWIESSKDRRIQCVCSRARRCKSRPEMVCWMGIFCATKKFGERNGSFCFCLRFFFADFNFLIRSFVWVCYFRLIVWKRTRKQTKFGKTTWKQRLKHANVIQFSVSVIYFFFSYARYHILPMYNLHLLINLSCFFYFS